jgi:predicted transposase YdaD
MDIEEQLRRVGAKHGKLAGQLVPIEEQRAELIREAAAKHGLSRRKIAKLVGISFQRVDQIVRNGSNRA